MVTPRQLRITVLVLLLVWCAVDIAHYSGMFTTLIELFPGATPDAPGLPRQVSGRALDPAQLG